MDQWIHKKIDSGDYKDEEEIIREALRMLRANDEKEKMELSLLKQKILTGIAQADSGDFSDQTIDDIIAEQDS